MCALSSTSSSIGELDRASLVALALDHVTYRHLWDLFYACPKYNECACFDLLGSGRNTKSQVKSTLTTVRSTLNVVSQIMEGESRIET